jgi:hypothetical protein
MSCEKEGKERLRKKERKLTVKERKKKKRKTGGGEGIYTYASTLGLAPFAE